MRAGAKRSKPAATAVWVVKRLPTRVAASEASKGCPVSSMKLRARSKDAALSAAVVNGLIHAYEEDENEGRVRATAEDSSWLRGQLKDLKARMEANQGRLSAF